MEHLQFYITDIQIDQPTLFKIYIRYYDSEIATAEKTQDNQIHISTEQQNKNNFECDIQLNNEEWNSNATTNFLQYFKDKKPKKITDIKILHEGLLLQELSKTSSTDKIMTGIQVAKYEGFYSSYTYYYYECN